LAERGPGVWIARVPDHGAAPAAAPAWMGEAEQRRWAVLSEAGRRPFEAARRLLRDALGEVTGLSADGWVVSAEAGTAPLARRLDGEAVPSPRVSIAHRLGWVAVAVGPADGGAIGVDVECERPSRGGQADRAALMMPADEWGRWLALAAGEREPALLRAWVAREAWFKAAGAGATWDFRRLVVEPVDGVDANVRIWSAGPVHVALYAGDAGALAAASCQGWPRELDARSSTWRVRRLATGMGLA